MNTPSSTDPAAPVAASKNAATTEAIRLGTEAALRVVLAEHRKAMEKRLVQVLVWFLILFIGLPMIAFIVFRMA